MLKEHALLPLFQKFIAQNKTGRRLNKNGSRIKAGTVQNYRYCYQLLEAFGEYHNTTLKVFEVKGSNEREHKMLRKYWSNFYHQFTGYLYKQRNCHDNYTGQNIKMIRAFFNWLNIDCGISTGPYHNSFYVIKEEIAIHTLSIEQLRLLMFDQPFEDSLSKSLKQAKDFFVIGCMTALRFSDLCTLKLENIETRDGFHYLAMRSQKTGIHSSVKLPAQVMDIINKYLKTTSHRLPMVSLFRFNQNIKKIGELAGWVYPVAKTGTQRGLPRTEKGNAGPTRFCDVISSHTMRRTCITTMLTSGMPEYIVRKVSGHTSGSKAFFRYVDLAQSLVDKEIDKMHSHFMKPINPTSSKTN